MLIQYDRINGMYLGTLKEEECGNKAYRAIQCAWSCIDSSSPPPPLSLSIKLVLEEGHGRKMTPDSEFTFKKICFRDAAAVVKAK